MTCGSPIATLGHAAILVYVGENILPCILIEGEVSLVALCVSTSFVLLWAAVLPKIISFECDWTGLGPTPHPMN